MIILSKLRPPLLLSLPLAVLGCTTPPESLSEKELSNIISVDHLIDTVIGFRSQRIEYRPFLTFPSDKDILKPALYVRDYCQYIGGFVVQTPLEMPSLVRTNPQFNEHDRGYVFDDIQNSFGRFECVAKNGFTVDIVHGNSSYVDDSARSTLVQIQTKTDREIIEEDFAKRQKLLNEQKAQLAIEKDIENKNAKALERFVNGQNDTFELGQEVCSMDNNLGYIEVITDKRFKVMIVGKADSNRPYAIYYDTPSTLTSLKNPILTWDMKSNWSACSFKTTL